MVLKWPRHSRKAGHLDSNSEQAIDGGPWLSLRHDTQTAADASARALCVAPVPDPYAPLTGAMSRRAYLVTE
jgi:hypothetical protein